MGAREDYWAGSMYGKLIVSSVGVDVVKTSKFTPFT